MTVENATYLKQLNPSYPEDSDLIKEGDDHIRLIKKALRNTFKNLDRQVLLSSEQMNELVSYRDYVSSQIERAYPVGAIYMSVNSTDPNTSLGFGTWEAISQGRVLIGAGAGTDENTVSKTFLNGSTGGEYEHTLSEDEIPSHNHKPSFSSDKTTSPEGGFKFKHFTTFTGNLARGPIRQRSAYDITKSTSGGFEFTGTSIPPHTHKVTNVLSDMKSTGGNKPHDIVQPFLTVHMWKRTL